jgi:Bacterial extracellular solute-binding proteins, family 3
MRLFSLCLSTVVVLFMVCSLATGSDIELAKKSTLESILEKGELHVGFNSGYMPFEMTNQKGDPDFLNWLDNFLRQIKNDERYDRIYNKWIKSTGWIKEVQ